MGVEVRLRVRTPDWLPWRMEDGGGSLVAALEVREFAANGVHDRVRLRLVESGDEADLQPLPGPVDAELVKVAPLEEVVLVSYHP